MYGFYLAVHLNWKVFDIDSVMYFTTFRLGFCRVFTVITFKFPKFSAWSSFVEMRIRCIKIDIVWILHTNVRRQNIQLFINCILLIVWDCHHSGWNVLRSALSAFEHEQKDLYRVPIVLYCDIGVLSFGAPFLSSF
jgi:hypothetical protein